MSVDTQDTAFDQIGGAARIDALVEAFYDLIETDPAYAELRAMHAADMTPVRASLKGWMTGWLGGPRDWFTQHPGVCMMSMHRAMPIDAATAGQWTHAMRRALDQAGVEPELAEALNEIFGRMGANMTTR
ncbi:group II truncated hemoglobin [Caulobacter sp. RHG1]|uniref:group II truncated hemoglobin n=1 Tax=Caulobacter sp. (strain RHG1) TaxID=2545762 RepID=UPI0015571436|nr:group II truncated hemoglobin [Caulobacter sp. RHG1]NQE62232.1 Hemoglobin-like protein HbO [Caulobacter sp. RHG1]